MTEQELIQHTKGAILSQVGKPKEEISKYLDIILENLVRNLKK